MTLIRPRFCHLYLIEKGQLSNLATGADFLCQNREERNWLDKQFEMPSLRPIGVRPLNERLIGAIGARPAEIEILSDFHF